MSGNQNGNEPQDDDIEEFLRMQLEQVLSSTRNQHPRTYFEDTGPDPNPSSVWTSIPSAHNANGIVTSLPPAPSPNGAVTPLPPAPYPNSGATSLPPAPNANCGATPLPTCRDPVHGRIGQSGRAAKRLRNMQGYRESDPANPAPERLVHKLPSTMPNRDFRRFDTDTQAGPNPDTQDPPLLSSLFALQPLSMEHSANTRTETSDEAKKSTRTGREMKKSASQILKSSKLPPELRMMILEKMDPFHLMQQLKNDKQLQEYFRANEGAANLVWRRSFLHRDPDTPLPPHLKWQDLAHLAFGKGCDGKDCDKTRTEYRLWEVGNRFCDECLKGNTIKVSELRNNKNLQPPNAWDYIPQHLMTGSRRGGPVVLRDHLATIQRDWEELMGENPTPEAVKAWERDRKAKNDDLKGKTDSFLSWYRRQTFEVIDNRQQRRQYLERRSLEANSELTPDILRHIPEYARCIEDKRAEADDNTFRILVPKLENSLEKVQNMLARLSQDLSEEQHRLSYAANLNRERDEVQTAFVEIAQLVIQNMGAVAPSDFVLRTLYDFWGVYNADSRVRPTNEDGSDHVLNLGDMVWIIENVFKPYIEERDRDLDEEIQDENWGAVFHHFQCAGCRGRIDGQARHWETNQLLGHIANHHNQHLDLFEFQTDIDENDYPHWLEWPANLPILARHHRGPGLQYWDLHNPYFPYEPEPVRNVGTASAFDGRVYANTQQSNNQDLATNFLFALKQLQGCELKGQKLSRFAIKILFEYVLRRFKAGHENEASPDASLLDPLLATSEYTRLSTVFGKHKCARCLEKDPNKRLGAMTFEKLLSHWRKKHQSEQDQHWSTDMIDLPSDEELLDQLGQPKMEKANNAFDTLFPTAATGLGWGNSAPAANDNSAAVDSAATGADDQPPASDDQLFFPDETDQMERVQQELMDPMDFTETYDFNHGDEDATEDL